MNGFFTQLPERLLAWAVHQMPAERREWGAAMLAELAYLRHPVTRWRFALDCLGVALFPPGKGEFMYKRISIAAVVSLLLVVPFALLEWRNNAAVARHPMAFPLALFVTLWLLPTVFFLIAAPLVRTARAGHSLAAAPLKLTVRVTCLALLAFAWGSLLADQMPCFLGYPNCD